MGPAPDGQLGVDRDLTLVAGIGTCKACPLGQLRDDDAAFSVPAWPGERYHPGGLALMSDSPGWGEERDPGRRIMTGKPGRSLDSCLKAVGMDRDELLMFHRVRCRPPGPLDSQPAATTACDEWTPKELDVYQPAVVVLMGNTAMRTIFGVNAKITRVRNTTRYRATGPKFMWGERVWVPTFHPSAARDGGVNGNVGRAITADLRLAKELLADATF